MIEFAALLLISMLFGGMVLYSFGFAPMVFSAMPADDAGRIIRAAFPWYYLFVIATAGLGGAILLLWNSWSGALTIAIAVIAIYARQVLMPQINAARDEQLRGNPDAKRRFGRLHGISVCEVRIIGSKSNLLHTLTAAAGVKPAMPGVRSSVLKWRRTQSRRTGSPQVIFPANRENYRENFNFRPFLRKLAPK